MSNKQNLKVLVRGAYDIQKLRIQTGNRIVGNFKAKLGQTPSMPEDTLSEEAKELLLILRLRNPTLAESVSEEMTEAKETKLAHKVMKVVKQSYLQHTGEKFPTPSKFKGDAIISDYTELCLLEQYIKLERDEESHFSRLKYVLNDYPIYTEFLKKIDGIGPAMAGVIISEIDITKCKYASSLHKYAGLDAVSWFELKRRYSSDAPERIETRHPEGYLVKGPDVTGVDNNWFGLYNPNTEALLGLYGLPSADAKGLGQGRSRKPEHLVVKKYIDKTGNPAERVGITFNPFLKTKLTGVLGPSFLRAGDNKYSRIYREYKEFLRNHPKHVGKMPGHIHNMSIRKTVKMLLTDLYTAWRELEGLPVEPPYEVAKRIRDEKITSGDRTTISQTCSNEEG